MNSVKSLYCVSNCKDVEMIRANKLHVEILKLKATLELL